MKICNVCKSYNGVAVVKDVSFTWESGVSCLMGPSGVGKTTLLRILLGLETPDSGDIQGLDGVKIGAVFQEPRLLPHLDAMGNLRFALGGHLAEDRAETMLKAVGLGVETGKSVAQYSGGMARRLALVRGLLSPCDALVLDEPFAGLDEENHTRALQLVWEKSRICPILLVTHDPNDVAVLNGKTVFL